MSKKIIAVGAKATRLGLCRVTSLVRIRCENYENIVNIRRESSYFTPKGQRYSEAELERPSAYFHHD